MTPLLARMPTREPNGSGSVAPPKNPSTHTSACGTGMGERR